MSSWLIAAFGAVIGAVIGSFIATLVLRWLGERSVVNGRSACDQCQRPLRWFELIPLASWLAARGRCHTCGGRIDSLHPLTECAAMLIGGAALAIRPDPAGIALALLGWQLLTLALLDARALWLPDRLTALLAITGLVLGGIGLSIPLTDRLIGGVAGFASLAAIALAYHQLRGRDGMGGGDPKLFGAIGLWLGWQALPVVLLFSALAGLGVAATRLGSGDWRTMQLPLGTLMAMAAGLIAFAMAWPAP
jgi:leader peptidase (prepilin peptidase) / N-methyltransferase